jgi:hypothetical protein
MINQYRFDHTAFGIALGLLTATLGGKPFVCPRSNKKSLQRGQIYLPPQFRPVKDAGV